MNPKELRFAMIGRCKRLEVGGDIPDRLTDLPINIKHQIQEHLCVEEAARMSVLSRPWRHVWASIPTLEFPTEFCKSKQSNTLIDIINTVLSQHYGAIKTFALNIKSIPASRQSVIDQWMLLLSRNGIMNLNLINWQNAHYRLPSYMFDVGLKSLSLGKCIFSPPCTFRGFYKLKLLELERVVIGLDFASSLLWMPNLEDLLVMSCSGIHHLKVHAPKLKRIYYSIRKKNKLPGLSQFMDSHKLESVVILSDKMKDKVRNLTYFLNCWPELRHLSLGSYYLMSFASGTDTERPPICHNNLRKLCLYEFDFPDENQVFSLLRMLVSCPNLKVLIFMTSWEKKVGMDVKENHFKESTYSRHGHFEGLNKLQTLGIHNYLGSRTELLLLRFILAFAPLLLKVALFVDGESIDESQCFKMSKEVMGFPSASPKFEIICEPSKLPRKKSH